MSLLRSLEQALKRSEGIILLPIIWAVVILVLIALPSYALPGSSILSLISFDKWVHAFMFGLLALLIANSSYPAQYDLRLQRIRIVSIMIFCMLYSAGTEILQASMFEFRTAELADHIANCLGTFFGLYFFNFIKN